MILRSRRCRRGSSRESIPDCRLWRDCQQSSSLQLAPMSDSPIRCTVDLDAPGKQFGLLEIPRSSNMSATGACTVPIVVIANGAGPTAVVLGGVHGDEPEGQIAAINLARDLRPEQVSGRVIVVPCVSPEASLAFTRCWPSGANMNRSFPGSPTGTEDEQLADFLDRSCSRSRTSSSTSTRAAARRSACPGRRCSGWTIRSSAGRWSTGCTPGTPTGAVSTSASPAAASSSRRRAGRARSSSAPRWEAAATSRRRSTGSPRPVSGTCCAASTSSRARS